MMIARAMAATLALSLLAVSAGADDGAAPQPLAGHTLQIESVAQPGKVLRVQDARGEDGVPMVLYPATAWRCMTWAFDADGDNAVRLINEFTHKTFGPTTTPATTLPDIDLPLTQHKVVPDGARGDAYRFDAVEGQANVYRIVHVATGLSVEATADGRVMLCAPSADAIGQRWRLLPKPDRYTG